VREVRRAFTTEAPLNSIVGPKASFFSFLWFSGSFFFSERSRETPLSWRGVGGAKKRQRLSPVSSSSLYGPESAPLRPLEAKKKQRKTEAGERRQRNGTEREKPSIVPMTLSPSPSPQPPPRHQLLDWEAVESALASLPPELRDPRADPLLFSLAALSRADGAGPALRELERHCGALDAAVDAVVGARSSGFAAALGGFGAAVRAAEEAGRASEGARGALEEAAARASAAAAAAGASSPPSPASGAFSSSSSSRGGSLASLWFADARLSAALSMLRDVEEAAVSPSEASAAASRREWAKAVSRLRRGAALLAPPPTAAAATTATGAKTTPAAAASGASAGVSSVGALRDVKGALAECGRGAVNRLCELLVEAVVFGGGGDGGCRGGGRSRGAGRKQRRRWQLRKEGSKEGD